MARGKKKQGKQAGTGANLGFEEKLRQAGQLTLSHKVGMLRRNGPEVGKKRVYSMKSHRQYVKEQIKRDPRLRRAIRSFRITIMERAARDTRFRQRLLTEAINQLLAGDLAAGKAMLRDYIKMEEAVRHEIV